MWTLISQFHFELNVNIQVTTYLSIMFVLHGCGSGLLSTLTLISFTERHNKGIINATQITVHAAPDVKI